MNATLNPITYDVIIAGAGPVGLFLACELALRQCSVLVLEKAEAGEAPLKKLPFGIRGLSSLSVESLDRRDLLDDLEVPKRIKDPHMKPGGAAGRQVGHFAGIPVLEHKVDSTQWKYRLPSSTPTALINELQEFETVVGRRAERLGVTVKRGAGVIGVEQNETGVLVKTEYETFQGLWVVGCDGARSAVRKAGGFDFAGTEPEFTGYTTQMEIVDPEKLKPGRVMTSTGMYMQSQPGYVVMQDFDKGAFHSSGEALTREHVQKLLRRISETDVTIKALHFATTWTDRARQATHYRNGRILLAGDAAHIHSPLGGQGLNLGIGDAMNLGWKLAATIRGKAPRDLLDSYEGERMPVGDQVLNWSRAQVAIMKPDPASKALHAILRDFIATGDGATYVAGRVWGIQTRYDTGGEHELVGMSAPNFQLESGKTVGELLRDGRGILLDFEERPSLRSLVAPYESQLKYVTGRSQEQFGLNSILIRPDGIIAWVSEGKLDEASLKQAIELYFVP